MIKQIKTWYQRRKMFKQTYRELSQLSSYELRDLGLDRTMITRVALEAAYGKEGRYV